MFWNENYSHQEQTQKLVWITPPLLAIDFKHKIRLVEILHKIENLQKYFIFYRYKITAQIIAAVSVGLRSSYLYLQSKSSLVLV